MKQKFQILIAVLAMAFAGCSSDRNKTQNKDSLMTDSAVMDTTDMGASPADTSAMRTDTVSKDTGSVVD